MPQWRGGTKRLIRMSDRDPKKLRSNRPALSLDVPEPPARPGEEPDFSHIRVPTRVALIDAGYWLAAYLTMGLVFFLMA